MENDLHKLIEILLNILIGNLNIRRKVLTIKEGKTLPLMITKFVSFGTKEYFQNEAQVGLSWKLILLLEINF